MATRRVLILFPGALGDLLCCWPAIDAHRALGSAVTLVARLEWLEVLPIEPEQRLSIDRREVADLFGTAALHPRTRALFGGFTDVVSFTGHGAARFAERLAAAAGVAPAVHPFRAMRDGEHAVAYYARCLGVTPLRRPLPLSDTARQWARALWQARDLGTEALAIHPGSGGADKNWAGMAAAAARWRARGGRTVVIAGPAESAAAVAAIPGDALVRNDSLERVAAVLSSARRYLGNDSGVSHLAGALGARGVVVFGPSDPAIWRPLCDGLRVIHGRKSCQHCGAQLCTHRVSVDAVCAALGADLGEPPMRGYSLP
jgi:ADP-heptose:LPS heptosyltransferase